ncbi:MAG TPA: protein translocase SEC61 complex subunit gamma [Candidatus Woesearchaeota archaeon]|nr:protein translocase SEC61 complex subunit gamma [Candidatus Woesearchaeota archaeon]
MALKEFIYQCKVALRLTRRPSNEEYKNILKITGLGILAIGALGFLISMVKYYLFG